MGQDGAGPQRSQCPAERDAEYQQLIRRYAEYAPVYDRRFARYSRATLGRALQAVLREPVESLLDVGCGTGLFVELVKQPLPDARMTGVDISEHMLEVARQRFAEQPYEWKVGAAESLPVESESFDVVVCNNAFHLVREAEKAVREFSRVLRPPSSPGADSGSNGSGVRHGGRVVIVDWCRDYLTIRGLATWFRLFGRHARFIRTLDDQVRLVEDNGFEIIEAERYRATWFWGMMCIVGRRK